MDFFTILTMIGGLAMFLYGMNVMGGGLEKMAGGKLEQILEKMTSNNLKAVGLGTVVTAVIQSSSATTVMVIGFVNSGIMKLKQAIGVIYGAKIGTTITAWILSLAGITGTSFILKLFKPTSFSPILAAVGIYFLMFSKHEKKKNIGIIFLGFAVLMFGMDTMSDAMSPLADMPEFVNILTYFTNPLLGLLVGAALTAIIQSSSASIGILQALSLTGVIQFGMALPIVMGQNIGTCVTAMLSSIGTSKNAKRAAVAHLVSTIIGAGICMAVFYLINSVVHFDFMTSMATPATIAFIHTAFNIVIVSILTPCIPLMEKLVCKLVKDEKKGEEPINEFAILDEKFLNTPGFAIIKARELTGRMARLCHDALVMAVELFDNYDEKKVEEVVELENRIDKYEDVLGAYLMKINQRDLTYKEGSVVGMLLHVIGDFERISDHAVNLVEAVQELRDKKASFTDNAKKELRIYTDAVMEIVERTVDVFESGDVQKAKEIEPLEDVIDGINVRVKNNHVRRLQKGECTIEMGFVLSDVSTNLERISDHCSNIAVYVMQVEDTEMERHDYKETLEKDDESFKKALKSYREKYSVPKYN